jgi:ABC-2 type transport system ATP-binding protein
VTPATVTAVCALRGVSFTYAPDESGAAVTILDDVSLALNEGEVVAIVGANGTGKSTLLRLIAGLLAPTKGSLTLFGESLTPDRRDLRSRVGYAPQRPTVWPELTAREQLAFLGACYGMDAPTARAEASRVLALFDLEHRADERARRLSGGMQQRLSLALACVHHPRVLLLDEPDAGLDAKSVHLLEAHLQRRAASDADLVVLTTHDEGAAHRLGTRLVRLSDGHVVEDRAP